METQLKHFKARYPAYKEIDDAILISGLKRKYPKYREFTDNDLIGMIEKRFEKEVTVGMDPQAVPPSATGDLPPEAYIRESTYVPGMGTYLMQRAARGLSAGHSSISPEAEAIPDEMVPIPVYTPGGSTIIPLSMKRHVGGAVEALGNLLPLYLSLQIGGGGANAAARALGVKHWLAKVGMRGVGEGLAYETLKKGPEGETGRERALRYGISTAIFTLFDLIGTGLERQVMKQRVARAKEYRKMSKEARAKAREYQRAYEEYKKHYAKDPNSAETGRAHSNLDDIIKTLSDDDWTEILDGLKGAGGAQVPDWVKGLSREDLKNLAKEALRRSGEGKSWYKKTVWKEPSPKPPKMADMGKEPQVPRQLPPSPEAPPKVAAPTPKKPPPPITPEEKIPGFGEQPKTKAPPSPKFTTYVDVAKSDGGLKPTGELKGEVLGLPKRAINAKTGMTPDRMAELWSEREGREISTREVLDRIREERRIPPESPKDAKQLEREEMEQRAPELEYHEKYEPKPVAPEELPMGATVKIGGEKYQVVDKAEGGVVLEDGDKIYVDTGETVDIDHGKIEMPKHKGVISGLDKELQSAIKKEGLTYEGKWPDPIEGDTYHSFTIQQGPAKGSTIEVHEKDLTAEKLHGEVKAKVKEWKEAHDAVQKPKTEKVDVRKQARHGKEVGKRDAEKEIAKAGEAEKITPAKPAPAEALKVYPGLTKPVTEKVPGAKHEQIVSPGLKGQAKMPTGKIQPKKPPKAQAEVTKAMEAEMSGLLKKEKDLKRIIEAGHGTKKIEGDLKSTQDSIKKLKGKIESQKTQKDMFEEKEDISQMDFTRTPESDRLNDLLGKLSEETGEINFDGIIELHNRIHDWWLTFGEAKREFPAFYKMLMSTYHKKSTAYQRAIADYNRLGMNKFSARDDTILAFGHEEKNLKIPERLEGARKFITSFFEEIEKQKIAERIISDPWPQGRIKEIKNRISELQEEASQRDLFGKKSKAEKELADLSAELEHLENMRYVPHRIVAQAINKKLNTLKGAKKREFLDFLGRISYKYKHREGKLTLREYVKEGVLKPEDVSIRRMMVEDLADYYGRSALKTLTDFAYHNGLVKKIAPNRTWIEMNYKTTGVIAPEYRGYYVHPLLASSYKEIKDMLTFNPNPVKTLLNIVKSAQFIKPTIIWVYDGFQKLWTGGYLLNPYKEGRNFIRAIEAVHKKNELYNMLAERGLFQAPQLLPRAAEREMIDIFMNQISDKYFKRVQGAIENILGMKASPKMVKNFLSLATRGIAHYTFTGDHVLRAWTVLDLAEQGWPMDKAIERAAKGHAAYAELSKKYKESMGWVFFVSTFRYLMPREMIRLFIQEPAQLFLDAVSGKKIPKYRVESFVKSMAAILAPILGHLYLKSRGWESDKFGWKWKKKVKIDGEEKEIVLALNYILNMPLKWYHRGTYHDPMSKTPTIFQRIWNVFRWEMQPLYRSIQDVIWNRRSFGGGQVFEPEASEPKQAFQIMRYLIGQWFRLYTAIEDNINMDDAEKERNKRILRENMTFFERYVLGEIVGYSYIRGSKERFLRFKKQQLETEYNERRYKIESAARRNGWSPKTRKKKVEQLDRWRRSTMEWIEKQKD